MPAIIILLLIAIGVGVVFFVPSVKNQIFGIKMEYKFEPEKSTLYKSHIDMKFVMPLPQMVKIKAKTDKISSSLNIDSSMYREISEVKDHIATIVSNIKIDKLMLNVNGKDIPPNIPMGLERKVIFRVNSRGKIQEKAEQSEESTLEGKLVFFQGWIMLPENTVKPGDTWKGNVDSQLLSSPLTVKLAGPINYQFVEITKYKGRECAHISFDGEFDTKSELKVKDLKLDMDAKAKLKGKAYFDYNKGELIFLAREIEVNVTRRVPLININITGDAKYQIRTEIVEE